MLVKLFISALIVALFLSDLPDRLILYYYPIIKERLLKHS